MSKATTEDSSAVGNAAAMRDIVAALAAVILPPRGKAGEDGWLAWVRAMQGKARAALSSPPRNCDVGTAVEQENRFIRFCGGKSSCKHCPLRNANSRCEFAWAQMPYKKEGAK